jgi:hypothetical protein
MGLGRTLQGHTAASPLIEARNRTYAGYRLRTVLRQHAGSRYRTVRTGAPAPASIVAATELMSWDQLDKKSAGARFAWSGKMAMSDLLHSAVAAGLDFSTATAAFELGSGGARLIRHLRRVEGLVLVAPPATSSNRTSSGATNTYRASRSTTMS